MMILLSCVGGGGDQVNTTSLTPATATNISGAAEGTVNKTVSIKCFIMLQCTLLSGVMCVVREAEDGLLLATVHV